MCGSRRTHLSVEKKPREIAKLREVLKRLRMRNWTESKIVEKLRRVMAKKILGISRKKRTTRKVQVSQGTKKLVW